MYAYQIETSVKENGRLSLHDLPFRSGDKVEIIILAKEQSLKKTDSKEHHPLHNKPVIYHGDITESAAPESDWEVLK